MRRAAVWLVWLCCVLPAASQAGVFDDEEARKQIRELRAELTQTLDTLRQRVDLAAKNQLEFANQGEAMRADIARLTGQIEVLLHGLETAQKRQQDFYVDLDNRLRKLESAPPPTAQPATAPPAADPQAQMREYEAALGLFRSGQFKEAQAALESFIATHPQASLLPNATYWLGASLFQQRQFARAAETYGKIPASWPNDPKAPDALLARANALTEARDNAGAQQTLRQLVEQYPASSAATTARARLKPAPALQKKR